MIDPGAKLGVSDGGNQIQGLLAVELFAVAPESFERRESITKKGTRAFGAYLFAAKPLIPFFVRIDLSF